MKAKELKGLSEKELKDKLVELRKELMKEYAQISTGTIPKNPSKIRETRKNVARIKTVLNTKEAKA